MLNRRTSFEDMTHFRPQHYVGLVTLPRTLKLVRIIARLYTKFEFRQPSRFEDIAHLLCEH